MRDGQIICELFSSQRIRAMGIGTPDKQYRSETWSDEEVTVDDKTIMYAGNEAGSQTELINPSEIAAMGRRPPTSHRRQPDDDDRGFYKRLALACVGILAVLAVLIAVILGIGRHHQSTVAAKRAECEQSLVGLDDKVVAYRDLVGGDGELASKIADVDVKDATAVKQLGIEMASEAPATVNCDVASVEEFENRIVQAKASSQWYDEHTVSLRNAIQAVNDSRQAKQVEDAHVSLEELLRNADNILASAQGHVTDEAVWNDLSKLIGEARNRGGETDMGRLGTLMDDLNAKMDAVERSNREKLQQEEQARVEAERKAREAEQKRKDAEAKAKAEEEKDKDEH